MGKKYYKKGEKIIVEGTPGLDMYIILSGKVKVYKRINKKRLNLATLGPDDFFGEMSLFLHSPRTATVEAVEKSEILTCDKKIFLDMVREEPELAAQILSTMAKRLQEAQNIIVRLEGEKTSLKVMHGIK